MDDPNSLDILYGHTPGHTQPVWVALLGELPQAVTVLERLGFQAVTRDGVELFVPPPHADAERTTVMHLASFAIFCQEERSVMYTQNHPALPEDRIEALLGMQAEEAGVDAVELARKVVRRAAQPPESAAGLPPLLAQVHPLVPGHQAAHR
ncbi:hypothetical protein [Streptomyces sp. NPDC048340]|uniref:hypothetical protein n=1 Tax=Streptomyces sp. NPDC048340 TaxID=3365537 RepID=UPI00370FED12